MSKQTIAIFIEVDSKETLDDVQSDTAHIMNSLRSMLDDAVWRARRSKGLSFADAHKKIRMKPEFSVHDKQKGWV